MRTALLSACLLLLLASCAFAAQRQDFKEFSIEVPQSWEMPVEPMYSDYGVIAVFAFGNADGAGAVVVNFTSSMGKSMAELMEDAKMKMKARDTHLDIVEVDATRAVLTGEKLGQPIRMIARLDEEAQKLALLVMPDGRAEVDKVVRSIVPVNPKLAFFK